MADFEEIPDFSTLSNLQIFELVEEIATKAGMKVEITNLFDEGPNVEPDFVEVTFPDGGKGRKIFFNVEDSQILISSNFQNFSFVPDMQATLNVDLDLIEARLESVGEFSTLAQLERIPGAEVIEEDIKLESLSGEELEAISANNLRRPKNIKLRVIDGVKSIEISKVTNEILFQQTLRPGTISIKLSGFEVKDVQEALVLLEGVANAFLFELDLVHELALGLMRYRPLSRKRRPKPGEKNVEFPKNSYSKEALALYQYGRSTRLLPLNQFLAYYQSLEYFFPIFARSETVNNLRTALLDPRLNPTKDEDVNRLINISLSETKTSQKEKDQLRATIKGCTTESQLKSFIESSKLIKDHFCSNKQAISLDLKITIGSPQLSLSDQVADRIYKIRCRVVHTKQDNNGEEGDLLLPFSPEVDSLKNDIELLKFLAQQALFAKASRQPNVAGH